MKKYIISALMISALSASAQTNITFETTDYKTVGVYDNWEGSPFRNGTMKGNAAVVDNPDTAVDPILGRAPNPSAKVVAVQRSRFGSNTFGVRIDLNEPFRLTKQPQYLHIMTLVKDKPVASRMMVIGLGKRIEEAWSWQDGQDEQFWAQTAVVDAGDTWQDVVCSFKGFCYSKEENPNAGIDIYSLILVPDLRSPHEDASDWVAYFDDIVVDNSPSKRFTTSKYALNFEKDQPNKHGSRKINGVGLKIGTKEQKAKVNGSMAYNMVLDELFSAVKGQSVTPTFDYVGSYMSGYAYVDWNNDGIFQESEMVSNQPTGNQIGNPMPAFTIPANAESGLYRMRYKVDWDNTDPAGNDASNNLIYNNGGGIVDVMLDVHEPDLTLTANQLNGDMLSKDGAALQEYTAPYGEDFIIKPQPAPGFIYNGMTVKYGYNLNDDQFDKNENPNWFIKTFDRQEGEFITLPGDCMKGREVFIQADMKSMNVADQLDMYIQKADSVYKLMTRNQQLITDVSQLQSPYTETKEGSLANLLDNNLTTFWHSIYTGGNVAAGTHYLRITLPTTMSGSFFLCVGRRDHASQTIANDHLTQAKITASTTATAVGDQVAMLDLPFGNQKETVVGTFDIETPAKYIRIYAMKTNGQQRGYWHAGEIQLYSARRMRDYVQAELVENLSQAIAKARTVTSATQDDVDALVAAYNAYVADIPEAEQRKNPTDISNVSVQQKSSETYDLNGRRVQAKPHKSIVISGGKKYITD
ncbi:MAG: hypothetical protein KBT12_02820 [Bacteroidales bacterium]|nr:hypothetical protein [Candidatus Physcousia equi]